MNKLERVLRAYRRHISVPWRHDIAPPQRVIFCVYHEQDERRLRRFISEFEIATRAEGHGWYLYDLTDTFPKWLTSQRYAERYYEQPHLLSSFLPRYPEFIEGAFRKYLDDCGADDNSVVAISGVGSQFGFLRVSELVDRLAPMVGGRLVVFFPGRHEGNTYRLLNAYDGWNYLATPITGDERI